MLLIERESLAWAAGVFDGEGWASAARYNKQHGGMTSTLTLGVGQKEPEMLHRLRAATSLGSIRPPKKRVPGRTPMWSWKVHGYTRVQAVAVMLWPWLGTVKRQQLTVVLRDAKSHPTHVKAYFTSETAIRVRARLRAGERQSAIAKEFNVPKQAV